MLKLDIEKFRANMRELPFFPDPSMSEGLKYLMRMVYECLLAEKDVHISNLDFNAFDSDDLQYLIGLYSGEYESKSYRLAVSLRAITPVHAVSSFV